MIIPPYITDNGPSWEKGMENDILPYRIDILGDEYLIIHPSGKQVHCVPEVFRNYLSLAVHGIINARVGYDNNLNIHLTDGDIQSKPTGQIGDWFIDSDGELVQFLGEMSFYDITTGEKRRGPGYARNNCWVKEEALLPLGGNVFEDFAQPAIFTASLIASREEILSVTLMMNNQPFTGEITHWTNKGTRVVKWQNGRYLCGEAVDGVVEDYLSTDFTVKVETVSKTFVEKYVLRMMC